MAPNRYGYEELKQRLSKANDALKNITEVEALDLKTINDPELEYIIDTRFPVFPFTSGRIPLGTNLFRARINLNNKPFESVQEIFAPASELITEYGRANRPHERIFYCASNYKLAVGEVLQNVNLDISRGQSISLTVGVWRPLQELHVTNIIHSPVLHQVRPQIHEAYVDLINSQKQRHVDIDFVASTNLICQFFADQFTKTNIESPHDYKISALFTRRLKLANTIIAPEFSNEKFDGVNYPSVAMKFNGDNQAIFIESAISKLQIVNALHINCTLFDFEQRLLDSEILYIDESISNGLINWGKNRYPYPQITTHKF